MAAREHRQQDFQLLPRPDRHKQPHAQFRWEGRAPDEWARESVRVAWRQADPVECGRTNASQYARFHEPTETLLIASYGTLKTVIPMDSLQRHEQQQIQEQL